MTAAELAGLPLIHSERSLLSWSGWFAMHRVPNANVARGLRFDRGYLSVQAAVDGLGVALESTVIAERELASGALVAPFLDREEGPLVSAHYLVCPMQHMRLTKVRQFHDWIVRMARESDEAGRRPARRAGRDRAAAARG
jgi:LysR family glycine cleavage system transcriptional activator